MKPIYSVHGIIALLSNVFQLVSGESYARKLENYFINFAKKSKRFHTTKYINLMLTQSTTQISNYPFSPLPFTSFLL